MTNDRSLTPSSGPGLHFPTQTEGRSRQAKDVQKREEEIKAILGGEVNVGRMGALAIGIVEDAAEHVIAEAGGSMLARRSAAEDLELRALITHYLQQRWPRFEANMSEVVDAVSANIVDQLRRKMEPPERKGLFG